MKKILIIGGGFAGLWSALSAKRHLRKINKEHEVEVSLINKDEYHGLRPRFYEEDLSNTRISLNDFLAPLDIKLIIGEVSIIDHNQRKITITNNAFHHYDSLILATGSKLCTPDIPGLTEYGFNVDTYQAAVKLGEHIKLLNQKTGKGRFTILVIGGGFTGVEAATDFMDRLRKLAINEESPRVIVMDRTEVASRFSQETRNVILTAFNDLGIETRSHTKVIRIASDHVELESGEIIDTHTVVWTAGMQSSLLTQQFDAQLDQYGRLPVDKHLRISTVKNSFAAGDVAAAMTDETRFALLSCQHAMPQGRIAGHNAVAKLFNLPLIQYEQRKFVTSIDLGSWGALYAEGWEQHITAIKDAAKKIKLFINHDRIYPPNIENGIDNLLNAAEPVFKQMNF